MAIKSLFEVKEMLRNECVHEVATAFLVNDFGKYRPNITFVISKDFEGNPLAYRSDDPTRRMVANTNIDIDGKVSVIFGDYWKSRKGGACFRPKPVAEAQHVLMRVGWGGAFNHTYGVSCVDGALYYRRAASNGGRLGATYMILPLGFVCVTRDPVVDGDSYPEAPDFEARAQEIRQDFAAYDRQEEAKAARFLAAKYHAEQQSREAKLSGLGERMEEVNRRRRAIGQGEYVLGETFFGTRISSEKIVGKTLYTEAIVDAAEHEITQIEEKNDLKAAVEKLRANFGPTVEAKGCQLGTICRFDDSFDQFTLEANDVGLSRTFRPSMEGIEDLQNAWPEFVLSVETKRIASKAAADKRAEEQDLRAQGYPTGFTCHHERGHGKTHRQCWVIQADGREREADEEVHERYKHVATVWNVVRPGEIALMWEKGTAASEHRFTVVYILRDAQTDEQVETICAILDGIEQSWQDARGLASGKPSPSVGDGWLHPKTGESLTKGFKTFRQKRDLG